MVFCVFIMGCYIGIKDWIENGYSTFYLVFGIQKIRKIIPFTGGARCELLLMLVLKGNRMAVNLFKKSDPFETCVIQ